jgi:hypothetical protein
VEIADVVLADVVARGPAHLVSLAGVIQQLPDGGAEGLGVPGIGQQDAGARSDLVDDPADRGPDDRPSFPHPLGDGQPEPLGQALLDDHARMPLERVDHGGVVVGVLQWQGHEQDPVADGGGQVAPLQHAVAEDGSAFGVVGNSGHGRAGQYQVTGAARGDELGEAPHHPRHVLELVPA